MNSLSYLYYLIGNSYDFQNKLIWAKELSIHRIALSYLFLRFADPL